MLAALHQAFSPSSLLPVHAAGAGMPSFHIRLMGAFELSEPGAGPLPLSPASRRLLAALALRGFRAPLPREALSELLWPGSAPERARSRLSSALHRLRRELGRRQGPAIREHGGSVGLGGGITVDFWELNARAEAVRGRPPEALEHAEMAALELAMQARAGPLLADLDLPACDAERFQCDENYELALETLMRYFRATGRRDRSIAAAKRLVSIDPLREDVHAALIALYGEKGQRGLAAAQFSRCAKALHAELGVTPGAEVLASWRACLAPAAPGAPERRPLKALIDEIDLSMSLLQAQIRNLSALMQE
jgi:DNA-binding SARP family transcriptional activator